MKNIQIEGDDTPVSRPVLDARDLADGKIDISTLPVSAHHTSVFDLMDEDDRNDYDNLYCRLTKDARAGKIVILSNTRETLTRPDRSTGWFKYIEWVEFDTSEILGVHNE